MDWFRRVLAVIVTAVVLAASAAAEQLSVATYTVANGLAGDQITTILEDHHGFLWIGTRTGLSRFDGSKFRRFGADDDPPLNRVWALFESSGGTLWVGTSEGLFRMRDIRAPDGAAFQRIPEVPSGVSSMTEDREGRLWVNTIGALYRSDRPGLDPFVEFDTGFTWNVDAGDFIQEVVSDDLGGIWVGTSRGLMRVTPEGSFVPMTSLDLPDSSVSSFFDLDFDRLGRLWISSFSLVRLQSVPGNSALDPHVSNLPEEHRDSGRRWIGKDIDLGPTLAHGRCFEVAEDQKGTIWVANHLGLAAITGETISTFGTDSGLASQHLTTVLADRSGNVWIGTESDGLMRLQTTGLTTFGTSDGLPSLRAASMIVGPSAEILAVLLPPERALHLFDGDRFVPIPIPLPHFGPRNGWGLNQVTFFDHEGQLWVPSPYGLFRFPKLESITDLPASSFEQRYLPGIEVFRIFEDSRGDLWMGTFGDARLLRWERATDTLHPYGPANGLPHRAGTAFAEDRSGTVWIGFYTGEIARWRHGAFEIFSGSGLPTELVNSLYCDRKGRLWIGAHSGGLVVTDDPTAEVPVWRTLTTNDGLASDGIFTLTEDALGRIYAGSFKGMDRLDPETGLIEHFDTSSGLANNLVVGSTATPGGDLWFATSGGVSRFRPSKSTDHPPPPVFVDRLAIDGTEYPVPLRGTDFFDAIRLPSGTDLIDIGFAAATLTPSLRVDFEFNIDDPSGVWTTTHQQRSIRLVGLSPGQRTIAIRTRKHDGTTGVPARISLTIPPPLWQRWWFLLTAAALIGAAVWLAHRVRIRRLEELYSIRSRIAADLHDEMGFSLARVAILADLAARTAETQHTADALSEIGETTRDLVDATSDMAWALDPRHDSMAAVIARVRRLATEVAEGSGARFHLEADPLEAVRIDPETRRHVFLILKESIRNACRHGRPTTIRLIIRRQASSLHFSLSDDGVGFDPESADEGQGLASMRRRAEEFGGRIVVDSAHGVGTTIDLEVPMKGDA